MSNDPIELGARATDVGSDDALVLALDQGGHSSRAIVFDASGRALCRGSRSVSEDRIGADRVEQDPEAMLRSLREAAEDALRLLGSRAREVTSAGLATQRSSLVCWDRTSGAPLSPVISWQDRRASAWLAAFAADADEIHRRTGLFLSPHYGVSKLAWCLANVPEVARARERGALAMGPLASFLAFRLLRERPFVVDPANASRTLLYSIAAREWDPYLCARFGIPSELLPKCVPTHGDFGRFEVVDASLPLRVMTGDQSAAIFAEGEPRLDTAYVNLGTGAFVQRPSQGSPVLLPRLLVSIVSSAHSGARPSASMETMDPAHAVLEGRDRASAAGDENHEPALFVTEGTINGAGSALHWIADELGMKNVETELDLMLDSVDEPPLFLNGVSGLAAPYWAPHFVSRFVGDGTPRSRIVAVVESILFLVQIILDEMSTALVPAERIQVSGGLANSDNVCARLADVTGLPVRRALDPEATARGLAWQTVGRTVSWRDEAARTFAPHAHASLARRCERFRRELERDLGAR